MSTLKFKWICLVHYLNWFELLRCLTLNIKKFDKVTTSLEIYSNEKYAIYYFSIRMHKYFSYLLFLLTVCGNRSAGDQRDPRRLDRNKCRTRCSTALDYHIGSESNHPADSHKSTPTLLIASRPSRAEFALFCEW